MGGLQNDGQPRSLHCALFDLFGSGLTANPLGYESARQRGYFNSMVIPFDEAAKRLAPEVFAPIIEPGEAGVP